MPCAAVPVAGRFASSVIGYADCEARTIGEAGYRVLTASGALVPSLLAVLLTILVALVGYRLILGDVPSLREGVLTIVKVGIVLAFATGWSAYRPVVYDVAFGAPADLVASIAGASGLPGQEGVAGGDGLAAHLDAVDGQFQQLAIENVNRPAVAVQAGPVPPPLFANFDVFALGSARIVFLAGALTSYAAPRLLAGLLLALGPLFVAFLLFDATRGLVEAWLGVLAGTALATVAASLVLAVELGLLEPWLADLIARRVNSEAVSGLASELLVTTLVFDTVLALAALGLALVAVRPRLARSGSAMTSIVTAFGRSVERTSSSVVEAQQWPAAAERSRASAIAEAAATLHGRENARMAGQAAPTAFGARPGVWPTGGESGGSSTRASVYRRRPVPRRSNSAGRRDRRS